METNTSCKKCGAEFVCGVTAGEETCWCMALPVLAQPDGSVATAASSCYCPACLKELLAGTAAA